MLEVKNHISADGKTGFFAYKNGVALNKTGFADRETFNYFCPEFKDIETQEV